MNPILRHLAILILEVRNTSKWLRALLARERRMGVA